MGAKFGEFSVPPEVAKHPSDNAIWETMQREVAGLSPSTDKAGYDSKPWAAAPRRWHSEVEENCPVRQNSFFLPSQYSPVYAAGQGFWGHRPLMCLTI